MRRYDATLDARREAAEIDAGRAELARVFQIPERFLRLDAPTSAAEVADRDAYWSALFGAHAEAHREALASVLDKVLAWVGRRMRPRKSKGWRRHVRRAKAQARRRG